MLDRIDRIRQSFVTRKAEDTDTHDYINQKDPDYYKNHKNLQDSNNKSYDDMTDISVDSLIIFLEGLLKEDNANQTDPHKPVSDTMRQAISAYDKTPHPQKRYTYLDADDQDYDMNLVRRLIGGLKTLKEDDIGHISLLQAEGFLESIEKTLEKLQVL
jgi:hypothetical protein